MGSTAIDPTGRFQTGSFQSLTLTCTAGYFGIDDTGSGTFIVGLTLPGERFRDVELVAANAVFALLFGLGGFAGPFLAGAAMDCFGPPGFPAALIAVAALYTVFAAWRQATRGRRVEADACDGTAD